MLITNFETSEQGAFLTWIQVYDILVFEILELSKEAEDFKWIVESVMLKHGLKRDSLDGIRYVFATVAMQFLGLSIKEADEVYNRLMDLVLEKEGSRTIECLDACLTLDFFRLAIPWQLVDCKQARGSILSIPSS